MDYSKNYYNILDVPFNATIKEIKKSYRRLALIYHPDRVSQSEKHLAEEKFKEIVEAHYVLSNAKKKKMYDQYLVLQSTIRTQFNEEMNKHKGAEEKSAFSPEDMEAILKSFFGDKGFKNFKKKQSRSFSNSGYYYKSARWNQPVFGLGNEGKGAALLVCVTYFCFRYFNKSVHIPVNLDLAVLVGLTFILVESKFNFIDEPIYESALVSMSWLSFILAMIMTIMQIT